jgi:hypothetical protein
LPELELVKLPLGMILYEAGGTQDYVIFPTDSIISLLYILNDGASAEIAVASTPFGLGIVVPELGGRVYTGGRSKG